MKKFTLVATLADDGNNFEMNAQNDGFNLLELFGILEAKRAELLTTANLSTERTNANETLG